MSLDVRPDRSGRVRVDRSGPTTLRRPRVLGPIATAVTPVLITGPAGSGKTALLQGLADARPGPVLLVAAGAAGEAPNADGALAAAVLAAAVLAAADGTDARPALEAVLGSGGRERTSARGVTVLVDRADGLSSPDAVTTVQTLLDAGVSVVLAARDSRNPVCRWLRLVAGARHVTAGELAFTVDEALELLDLPGAVRERARAPVAAYVRRCQGWPAAVGILARHVDHAVVDDHAVEISWAEFVEYLDDRVLAELDRDDLHLLALAAVQDEAPPPRPDDVVPGEDDAVPGPGVAARDLRPVGVTDVVARLERLAARGLLGSAEVPRVGGRINPALREAVLAALHRDETLARVVWAQTLSQRLDDGRPVDALRLAAGCGFDDLLADTLERAWPACYLDGADAERALARVPMAVRLTRPSLVVLHGMTLAIRHGDPAAVDVALRMVDGCEPPPGPGVSTMMAYCSLTVALATGRHAEADGWADRLVADLGPDGPGGLDPGIRSTAWRGLGFHDLVHGDLRSAREQFQAARSAGAMAGSPSLCAAASAGLALIDSLFGRAVDAERHLRECRAPTGIGTAPPTTEVLATIIAGAISSMLRGDVSAAVVAVDGLHDVRGEARMLSPFLAMTQALSHGWQGDGVRAGSEAEATAARTSDGELTAFQRGTFGLARFMGLIGSGRLAEAEAAARAIEADRYHILCPPTAVAMALLGQGDPAGAVDVVRGCLDAVEDHLPATRALALWVAAIGGWCTGDPDAVLLFERSLAVSISSDVVGYTVNFMPQPPQVGELLTALRARTGDPEILAVCDRIERAPAVLRAGVSLPALTSRERDIARRLATTPSVAALAAQLFVSVNTVKTQLRTLYRKLGVSDRGEAIEVLTRHGVIS